MFCSPSRDRTTVAPEVFSTVNEETGHYMERFWCATFSERYIEWDPSEREEEDKEVVMC
jgi:hypothetical protein